MSDYRAGQLYIGAEGDLLFTILGEDGIGFVTNRGTSVPLAEAEQVYAPLELVRDIGDRPQVPAQDVIAAVYEALNVPDAADGAVSERKDLVVLRAGFVAGVLQPDGGERSAVDALRLAAVRYPVTYPIRGQQPYDGRTPIERYAAAIAEHFTAPWTEGKPPAVGAGISLELPGLGAVMVWDREVGWYIYRLGSRGQRTRLRFLGSGQLTPTPQDLAKDVRAWAAQPASFPSIRPSCGSVKPCELDALLSAAAGDGGAR